MAEPPGRFSLYHALFGGADDQVPAPAPWLEGLVRQQLDAKDRLSLFQTSRAARDRVLQTAHGATLTLTIGNSDAQKVDTSVSVNRSMIRTRSRLPISVVLSQCQADPTPLFQLPHLLHGLHLTSLRLDFLHLYTSEISSAFLSAACVTLSTLHTLHLGRVPGPLPPASQLPQLRELQLHMDKDSRVALRTGLAGYVGQLTTLKVSGTVAADWQHILTATTHSLQTLAITEPLCSDLLKLLLDRVPELTDLSAKKVDVATDFSDRAWLLLHLRLQRTGHGLHNLARLPTSVGGRLNIHAAPQHRGATLCVDLDNAAGIPPEQLQRLPEFTFTTMACVALMPLDDLSEEDQPAALQATLQQLAQLHSDHQEVWLDEWDWTPELAAVVTTHTAAPHALPLYVHQEMLDDALLELLQEHAPWCRGVAASGLEILWDHAGEDCAWSLIILQRTHNLLNLRLLPQPLGMLTVALREDSKLYLSITQEQIDMGEVADLSMRLVRCTFKEFPDGPARVVVPAPTHVPTSHQPASLTNHLQLLSEFQVEGTIGIIQLEGWVLTPEIMTCLSALPAWSHTLELRVPQMPPNEQHPLHELALHVPTTFTKWRLVGLNKLQVVEVCMGLWQHWRGRQRVKLVFEVVDLVTYGRDYLNRMKGLIGNNHVCIEIATVAEDLRGF